MKKRLRIGPYKSIYKSDGSRTVYSGMIPRTNDEILAYFTLTVVTDRKIKDGLKYFTYLTHLCCILSLLPKYTDSMIMRLHSFEAKQTIMML